AAVDAGDQRRAPWHRLVGLELEAGATEVVAQQVDAAHLLARRVGAVVDTGVADQLLQQRGDLGGGIVAHATAGGHSKRSGCSRVIRSQRGWKLNQPAMSEPTRAAVLVAFSSSMSTGFPAASAIS